MSVYWIDSDVLIWSKDNAFRFDAPHAKAFWNTIQLAIENESAMMTKRNYAEMTKNRKPDDRLMQWLKLHYRPTICVPATKGVQDFAKKIGDDCYNNPHFLLRWNIEFSRGADAWLIAQAAVSHGIVVTRESNLTPDARKPKIPNLCKLYNVEWMNMYDMLDRLQSV